MKYREHGTMWHSRSRLLIIGSLTAAAAVSMTQAAKMERTTNASNLQRSRLSETYTNITAQPEKNVQTPVSAASKTPTPANASPNSSSLTINGQPIALPTQGSTHQVISGKDGQTTIDASVDYSSTSSGSTTAATRLNISSQSTQTVESNEHSPPQ
jgi:hypothetical protein